MSYRRKEIIGDCTLYLGDCYSIIPHLKGIDACISDPPYGIGYVHSGKGGCLAASTKFGGEAIIGDDKPFDPEPFFIYDKIALFGANHFANKLPPSANWLIWDKRDSVCSNDQADCEMVWTNQKGPARLIRHLWNGMLKASERGVSRVHPTQKPVAVMEWVIRQMGDTKIIIDPFMGSGTTGVACVQMGRKFIGIELDEQYFEIACQRIRDAYKQPDMFIASPEKLTQLTLY